MNDIEKLEKMLEQATAGEQPEDLDADTTSLREAWQSFGRLLEAAQPRKPMVIELAWKAVRGVRRRRAQRAWIVAGALAASLLVAATLWMSRSTSSVAPSGIDQTASMSATRPSRSAQVDLQWNDESLDKQFADVEEGIAEKQLDDQFASESYAVLQYDIEQTQDDLDSNRL